MRCALGIPCGRLRLSAVLIFLFFFSATRPCPSSAQTSDADTTAADSIKTTPRGALLRSAVLPGWGQVYNKRPLKGALFGTAALALLSSGIAENRSLGQAQTPDEHERRADRRNTRFLFLGLVATFAALDAYVDAHLADFDVEVDVDGEAGRASLQLTLFWDSRQRR